MSSSKIEILNLCLHKLGTERINSIQDENKRAKMLLDIYEISRKTVLEEGFWNFAISRIVTQPDTIPPAFEYQYRHRIPSNCLRVIEEIHNRKYVREGQYLLTNNDKLYIKYIRDVTNEGEFSDTFAEALALKLAYNSCYTITQNENLKKQLLQEYQAFMELSRSYSSQESNDFQDMEINEFIDVRYL